MSHNRKAYILTPSIAKSLIPEAMVMSNCVKTDELDCSISFARRPTNKTPEEVFQLGLAESTAWNFIYREMDFVGEEGYYDVGCATISDPSYFLWIGLSVEDGQKLIEKYNLEARYSF